MKEKVVTRFAPSPTGYLHIGGARTALFNYLFARKYKGIFRLRIEDTDRARSSGEMIRQILDGLKWLGLQWEGEVIHQADNAALHRKLAHSLLEAGKAYRCFCTREELEARRKQNQDFRYDRKCRFLSEAEIRDNLRDEKPFSIRFKMPEGETFWNDGVHGEIRVGNSELDDFIIVRSDGSPIYQLAVVVDDHDMEITRVIRGDDHISNTPKQILLYQAFGWSTPQFSHVPLILGQDKKRLSKRHGATAVGEYREMGVLPEALFNFLALLGWTPADDREIMSRDEIIKSFSLEGISKKSAVFDEQKLQWMNGEYINLRSTEELFPAVASLWQKSGLISAEEIRDRRDYLMKVIEILKSRIRLLNQYAGYGAYFFRDPQNFDEKGMKKHLKDPQVWDWLRIATERLENQDRFDQISIEEVVRNAAEQEEISAGKLIHPIRLALTGMTVSPGLFELMELLGKEIVVRRLKEFIELGPSFFAQASE
ncbi:MAG: glutamate--tRNA ligase [Calditrichia bacterium]